MNSPFVPGNLEKFPLCSPELLLEAFLLLENEEAEEEVHERDDLLGCTVRYAKVLT